MISSLPVNPVHRPRWPLGTVDSVAMLAQRPVQVIYDRADGGVSAKDCYRWVWNISTNPVGKIRNLRFWLAEVADAAATANFTLDEVIRRILPETRREFHAGELCNILSIRPITLTNLRTELGGSLRSRSGVYPRSGLVQFFKNRWLGNVQTQLTTQQITP